jgi:hypothetical protein
MASTTTTKKKKTAPKDSRPESKSGIHIKPSKEGSFTRMAKKAGKSVQAEASAVLKDPDASPVAKKKANFAKVARTWNHKGKKK